MSEVPNSETEWENARVNISLSELLTRGIQLEAEKYVKIHNLFTPPFTLHHSRRMATEEKKLQAKGHPTSKQLADHQLSVNRLVSRIENWIQTQVLIMPQAAQLRLNETLRIPTSSTTFAEQCNIPMWLPSEILRAQKKLTPGHPQFALYNVDQALIELEFELREGQAWDALAELRSGLRFKSQAVRFKVDFISGVHATTRAMATLQNLQQRIDADSAQYRAAWDALQILGPALKSQQSQTSWLSTPLRQLQQQDVRMMNEADATSQRQTEGTRTTSWIWTTTGVSSLNDDLVFDEG